MSTSVVSETVTERPDLKATGRLALVLMAILGFGFRVALIDAYPTVFAWDAFTRLWDPSQLLVRHWLPVPQLPIFLIDAVGGGITTIRLTYALIGSLAALAIGCFIRRERDSETAIGAVGLATTAPVFAIHTIVPYQEGALLLFLFLFLFFQPSREIEGDDDPRSGMLAALCLALACLCRYEAWIFAGLFCLRPIARRDLQGLRVFLPAALVMAAWLAALASGAIDATNPMASEIAATNPSRQPPVGAIIGITLLMTIQGIHWIVGLLAIVGAFVAARRGGVLGRELLAFWLATCALAVLRAVSDGAVPNQRMALVPILMVALYAPIGLMSLLEKWPLNRTPKRALVAAVLLVAIAHSAFETNKAMPQVSGTFAREFGAAREIEQIRQASDGSARIGVVPRPILNRWGEHPVKAIFGQSMSLRRDDPNLVIGLERVKAEEDSLTHIVFFDAQAGIYRTHSPGPQRP